MEENVDAERGWKFSLQNVVADFLAFRYKADFQRIPNLEANTSVWWGGYIWSFWQPIHRGGLPYNYDHEFNVFETPMPQLDEDAVRRQTDPRSDLRTRGTRINLPQFGNTPHLDLSDLCVDLSAYANSI